VLSVLILTVSSAIVPKLLQNDGSEIPVVGLGTGTTTVEAVQDAIEAGYRHFDTSLDYKDSEITIGKALKALISEGKIKRTDLYIVSKLEARDHARSRVPIGIKQSLANLGLDYLDLYLIHWPNSTVDILETWHGMEDVHKLGLTKSIGLSNFNEEQINRILANGTIKPVTNQVQCNPYNNQKKLLNYLNSHNITLTAYSPLGGTKGSENLLSDAKLHEIGTKHSVTSAQVALKYQLQRNVIVIPKSLQKKYIYENIDLFNFTLSDNDIKEIDALNKVN